MPNTVQTGTAAFPTQQTEGIALDIPPHVPDEFRELAEGLPEPLQTAVRAAHNTPGGVRLTMGNVKGGVMKTTEAVYTALILSLTGEPVLLVDADDANKACVKWQHAAGEDWPSSINVVLYNGPGMTKQVNDLMSRGFKHLIIDVGPTDKGVLKAAWALTKVGIVPTQQQVGDIVQLSTTFELLKEMGEEIALHVLLARTFPKRNSYSDAREYIGSVISGDNREFPGGLKTVKLLDSTVPYLEPIADAWGSVPQETKFFDAVLAETLGVPAAEIARREQEWLKAAGSR